MNVGRLLLALLPLCWISAPAAGQTIQSVSPAAAMPGQMTEMTLRGTKLASPLRVWTSFPAQVEVVEEEGEHADRAEVKLQVTVAAGTPPQIGGVLIATPSGVSDPFFLAIDDLPSVPDNGKNHTLDSAQEVTLPVAVDGLADGTSPDCYRFAAAAGDRLSMEVLAARFGSELDPVVTLLDAAGQTLAIADDDFSTGADSRLSHTFATAGNYVVSIRDVRYRGGANFRYRLRLGDFPLVSTPYPLGVVAGQGASVEPVGPAVENVSPREVSPAETNRPYPSVAFKTASGRSSAFGTLVASAHPQFTEVEPNDTPDAATKIAVPGGISGRFHSAKDRDHFIFDAKAGEALLFRPITRSIGSPCYLQLAVFKPDGGLLAEAPVTDNDEQPLSVQIPADGAYRLVVEDLLRRGGPEFAWHVSATPAAGAALQLKPDKNTPHKLTLPQNGAVSLEIQAVRQGFDGPITLAIEPADRGFVLVNNVIAEKQAAGRLIIAAPPEANRGDLIPLRIVGTVERNGQTLTVPLSTSALLRTKSPHLAYPPAWLDGLLPVGIGGEAPELFTISPSSTELSYPRGAAQLDVTLNMERKQGEFKDPLTVVAESLPAGVTAEIKREGNGPQEKYYVVLKAPADIAAGQHEIRFRCYGEFKGQGKLLTITLPLKIE